LLSFVITDGNIGGTFGLDPSSGELTIANSPDFETTSNYSLTVEVSDAFGGNVSETVDVQINDLPEGPGPRALRLSDHWDDLVITRSGHPGIFGMHLTEAMALEYTPDSFEVELISTTDGHLLVLDYSSAHTLGQFGSSPCRDLTNPFTRAEIESCFSEHGRWADFFEVQDLNEFATEVSSLPAHDQTELRLLVHADEAEATAFATAFGSVLGPEQFAFITDDLALAGRWVANGSLGVYDAPFADWSTMSSAILATSPVPDVMVELVSWADEARSDATANGFDLLVSRASSAGASSAQVNGRLYFVEADYVRDELGLALEFSEVTPAEVGGVAGEESTRYLSDQHSAVADLNGDGISDVVSCTGEGAAAHLLVVYVDTVPTVDRIDLVPATGVNSHCTALAVGDVLGDPAVDIVVAVDTTTGAKLLVYEGISGSPIDLYSATELVAPGDLTLDYITEVALADMNLDGKLDLVVALEESDIQTGGVEFVRNQGGTPWSTADAQDYAYVDCEPHFVISGSDRFGASLAVSDTSPPVVYTSAPDFSGGNRMHYTFQGDSDFFVTGHCGRLPIWFHASGLWAQGTGDEVLWIEPTPGVTQYITASSNGNIHVAPIAGTTFDPYGPTSSIYDQHVIGGFSGCPVRLSDGDVNGDGYGDLIAISDCDGRAQVVLGSQAGVLAYRNVMSVAISPSDAFFGGALLSGDFSGTGQFGFLAGRPFQPGPGAEVENAGPLVFEFDAP